MFDELMDNGQYDYFYKGHVLRFVKTSFGFMLYIIDNYTRERKMPFSKRCEHNELEFIALLEQGMNYVKNLSPFKYTDPDIVYS